MVLLLCRRVGRASGVEPPPCVCVCGRACQSGPRKGPRLMFCLPASLFSSIVCLWPLLYHLSVPIQRVLEMLSERTFADITLAFFIIFLRRRKQKKKKTFLNVHVKCALVSFVVGGTGAGKRLASVSSASSMDYSFFFFLFFKHYYYLFSSDSDAATCPQVRLSQLGTIWNLKIKSHFTSTWIWQENI